MNLELQSSIIELEERLRLAMLRSEVSVLDELIAPELLFTSHLGQRITKQDDLAFHQSGALQLTALTPSEQHIQINHGFVVVSVLMHLVGTYEGTPIDFNIRYTRIWAVTSNGSMQIIAGHASTVQKG